MTRTETEKFAVRHAQDHRGAWRTYRTTNHDTRYCDICDSDDVEHGEPHAANGWSGGVNACFVSNGPSIVVIDVLCREHKIQHDEAESNAPRVEVDVLGGNGVETERVYYCPAHQAKHFEC